jgi:hypothetical protein
MQYLALEASMLSHESLIIADVIACRIEKSGHSDKKVRVSHRPFTDLPCARANPAPDPTYPLLLLEDREVFRG